MLDLLRHNRPVKGTARFATTPGVIPTLPNAAALPVAILPASGLPRESRPRIMNPAGVPLTEAARFTAHGTL